MPSRAELESRAGNQGIDHTLYPNDSKLEQKVIYEERDAATAAGVKASGTVTSDATAPDTGGTITISSVTYTARTALTGVRATGTLTSDATAPSDGDTFTVGNKTYTFKTALTPTEGEVLIGASAAAALDNLKSAINHTGTPDTDYKCAAAHTQVRATTNTDTTQVVEALAIGTAGNSLALSEVGTHTTVSGATLSGGVATVANEVLIGGSAAAFLDNLKLAVNRTVAPTEFSEEHSATTANPEAEATTNTNTTQLIVALAAGDSGNDIVFTESATHITVDGSGTLAGGSDATVTSSKSYQLSGGANV